MCNLSERLENYVRDNNKVDLTYRWKGRSASDVNELFSQWNRDLNEVLSSHVSRNQKASKLEDIVKKILRWGGIHRFSDNRLNHYVNKILDGKFEGQEIDEDTLLSSWTKILAAYDPVKYCIYDSRVAIALKILVPEYDWFIPRRRRDDVGSFLRKQYVNPLTEAESYKKYLDLLSSVDAQRRGLYEKKLFMLGGKITINV